MEDAFMFLLGLLIGASLVMLYGWWQIEKMKKAKKILLDQVKARALEMDKRKNSIKDRLASATELAQTQMAIRSQLEMPSKNGLHSKYKSDLASELQNIEQRKIDILKTILAEGVNPMITVIDEGGARKEISLAEYVNDAIIALEKSLGNPIPPPPDSTNARKSGKFIVYKGGKDDGTTH